MPQHPFTPMTRLLIYPPFARDGESLRWSYSLLSVSGSARRTHLTDSGHVLVPEGRSLEDRAREAQYLIAGLLRL